ncbi:MAG: hypothetical protein GY778_31035 [bacterium]|nr:hypothetical protein [bacterium]
MNRLLVVPVLGALLVSAVGCQGPQPVNRGISAPLPQRSVAPEAAFAAAEQVLAEHYELRTRDLRGGYLETAPLETIGPRRSGRMGDAVGMPRRLRQYARVRIEPVGDGVNIWCSVHVQRYESDAHRLFVQEHGLSDIPSERPADSAGPTTVQQNAVWQPAGRDTEMERRLRRQIQDLLASAASP